MRNYEKKKTLWENSMETSIATTYGQLLKINVGGAFSSTIGNCENRPPTSGSI